MHQEKVASASNLPADILRSLLHCLAWPPYCTFLVCRSWYAECRPWLDAARNQLPALEPVSDRVNRISKHNLAALKPAVHCAVWTMMDALWTAHKQGMHIEHLKSLWLGGKFVGAEQLYDILRAQVMPEAWIPNQLCTPLSLSERQWLTHWDACCKLVAEMNLPLVWQANLLVEAIKDREDAERLADFAFDALFEYVVKEGTYCRLNKFIDAAPEYWWQKYSRSTCLLHSKCTLALASFKACMRLLALDMKLPDAVMQEARAKFASSAPLTDAKGTSVLTAQCYAQQALKFEQRISLEFARKLVNGEWNCCEPSVWNALVKDIHETNAAAD